MQNEEEDFEIYFIDVSIPFNEYIYKMKHYNHQDDDVEVDELMELLDVSSINIKFIFNFVVQLLARLEGHDRYKCK